MRNSILLLTVSFIASQPPDFKLLDNASQLIEQERINKRRIDFGYVSDNSVQPWDFYEVSSRSFEYNADGTLHRFVDSDMVDTGYVVRSRTTISYDLDGNDTLQFAESYDTSNAQWVNSLKHSKGYDSNGNEIMSIVRLWENENWKNFSKYVRSYTSTNLNESNTRYHWQDTLGWYEYNMDSTYYDSIDRIDSTYSWKWYSGVMHNYKKTNWTYFGETHKEGIRHRYDTTNSNWDEINKYLHYYNSSGEETQFLLQGKDVNNQWVNSRLTSYTYFPDMTYVEDKGWNTSDDDWILDDVTVWHYSDLGNWLGSVAYDVVDNQFRSLYRHYNYFENAAPRIIYMPNIEMDIARPTYTYRVVAVGDPEPTISLVSAPNGVAFDSASSTLQWSYSNSIESGLITLTAENENGSHTRSFYIGTDLAVDENDVILNSFELNQPYPNPFNSTLSVTFKIPSEEWVNVHIYDILGKRVGTLVDQNLPEGTHKLNWESNHLATGVYFIRMDTEGFTATRKAILLK